MSNSDESKGSASNASALDSVKKIYNDTIDIYNDVSQFSLNKLLSDTRNDINSYISTNRKKAVDTTFSFAKKYNPYTFLHDNVYVMSEYVNENHKYASSLCRSHPSAMVSASSSVILMPFALRYFSKSLRSPKTTIFTVCSIVAASTCGVKVINYKWDCENEK